MQVVVFFGYFFKGDRFCEVLFAFLHKRSHLKRGLLYAAVKEIICFLGGAESLLLVYRSLCKQARGGRAGGGGGEQNNLSELPFPEICQFLFNKIVFAS